MRLVRVNGTYEYPADFIIRRHESLQMRLLSRYAEMQMHGASIERYINRISQPLLDRIDICVETPQIKFEELNGTKKRNVQMQSVNV